MCTAVSYTPGEHYFGRNLDYEFSHETTVTICPRNYPLSFRKAGVNSHHYAIIGIAYVNDGYPLYYDATNEHGLSIAALNFPENAVYQPASDILDNITPFELIPWILCQCRTVAQSRALLNRLNLLNESFSCELPLSPLHWILSDKASSLVLEPMTDGLKIYDNPTNVLTNNPPFPFHMHNLNNYLNLTSEEPTNRFASNLELHPYSRGMGAMGLPGDLSSSSRFIRAAFTLHNAICDEGDSNCVNQFFHILGSVYQPSGCSKVGSRYEKTIYSSCCNTNKGIYYYKTYFNSRITAVDMHNTDLEGCNLRLYPMRNSSDFFWEH